MVETGSYRMYDALLVVSCHAGAPDAPRHGSATASVEEDFAPA